MGVVDRTSDFRQILNELSANGNMPGFDGPAPQAQSKLNIWSAEIGGEIHLSSLKVQELRKMSRKKGLFDDKTNEIQALTAEVSRDMQTLQKKIEVLEAESRGTGPNRSVQAHSSNMVSTLKTRLMEVGKDFKDALEDRTKSLEQQDKRRQLYATDRPGPGNPFQKNSPAPRSVGNSDDLEGGGGMSAQTQYQNNRVDAVQSVQRTIGELAQMFQKMASMVTEQEEMIQRIDHDLDDTLDNVNNAQDNLLKYFKHISSNRGLIIKVFLILIFFVVFFVIFLA